jgi:hypothetical protein
MTKSDKKSNETLGGIFLIFLSLISIGIFAGAEMLRMEYTKQNIVIPRWLKARFLLILCFLVLLTGGIYLIAKPDPEPPEVTD